MSRRQRGGGGEGWGEGQEQRPRKKRSEPLKAAQAAYAAVMASSALHAPPLARCELCAATFTSELAMQQHVSGPVHRKNVERAQREAQQRSQQSLAIDALQAAAWQGRAGQAGGAAHAQQQAARPPGPGSEQQQQRGKPAHKQQQHRRQAQQDQQRPPQEVLTHEQVLAQARRSDPLSLDGECCSERRPGTHSCRGVM